jgi:hypothetical protein
MSDLDRAATGGWAIGESSFTVGDKIWPKDDSVMILQHAPQIVIAMATHLVFGEWLWISHDVNGASSSAAVNWTTEEPSHEERVKRLKAKAARAQENWNTRKYIPGPPVPVDVPTGWECPSCATFWSPQVKKCDTCSPTQQWEYQAAGVPFLPQPSAQIPHTTSKCTGFTTCPTSSRGGLCGCE